jgi:putative endonuclease
MENTNKRTTGTLGEQAAGAYLKKSGCEILFKNYRVGRMGEIDIIVRDGDTVCFVEVKARSSDAFGRPCEAVDWRKQQRIRKVASVYLGHNNLWDEKIRFDVVEILYSKGFVVSSINVIKGAF